MRAGAGYRLLGQHRADQMVFRTLGLSLAQGQMVDRPARGDRSGRDAGDDEHQYHEPQHGLDPIGGTAQRIPVEPQPADARGTSPGGWRLSPPSATRSSRPNWRTSCAPTRRTTPRHGTCSPTASTSAGTRGGTRTAAAGPPAGPRFPESACLTIGPSAGDVGLCAGEWMDSMLRAEGDEMSANPDICRGRCFSFCMAGLAVACLVAAALGAVAIPAAAQGSGRAALAAVSANPAQAARSAVALAVDPAGTGYAFYRGQADAVYVRTVRSGSWSAQTNLGGTIIGAPAATVAGSAVLVAARGTDNALWVRTLTNGTWSPWRSWGGTMSASPAIAGASTGRVDAFGRAPRGGLWTRTMSPSGAFSAWTALGGQVITS